MTDTSVTSKVHQALDVHRHFTAQVALDREPADLRTQRGDFRFGEILHERVELHAGSGTRLLCLRVTDAIDMGESHPHMFVHRYVDAGDTGHFASTPRDEKRGTL